MLALRLPPEIEQRLDALARKSGRSKSYYAREAILRHIEDIEDDYLARRRLARGGSRMTLESLSEASSGALSADGRALYFRCCARNSYKALA